VSSEYFHGLARRPFRLKPPGRVDRQIPPLDPPLPVPDDAVSFFESPEGRLVSPPIRLALPIKIDFCPRVRRGLLIHRKPVTRSHEVFDPVFRVVHERVAKFLRLRLKIRDINGP